jgi:hypothetical protein
MEPAAVLEEVAVVVVHVIHVVAVLYGLVPAIGAVLVILVTVVLFVLGSGISLALGFNGFFRLEGVRILPERRRHFAHRRPPPVASFLF